jgi:hypothetical protein
MKPSQCKNQSGHASRSQRQELPRFQIHPHGVLSRGHLGSRGQLGNPCGVPQLDIWFQFPHHASELIEVQRLRAIADSFFRMRMHFDNQSIRADSYAGAR